MAFVGPLATLTQVNVERKCPTALSDTAEELLKFRLYQDDEGIWICCDYCNKWRYAADQKDPAVFQKRGFVCKDVKKKCSVGSEGESNHKFYDLNFCAGSLVWAKRPDGRKAKDWPWWPALVEDSPDSVSQYFLLDQSGNHPIAYHVTYLDAFRTSGWIASDLIKPFEKDKTNSNRRSAARLGKKQRFLEEAVERAENAAKYGVVSRLEMFSCIAHMARLKGLILPCKVDDVPDKILNGLEGAPELIPETDTVEPELQPPTIAKTKGARGRPRKRKAEASESEVRSKKPRPAKAQETNDADFPQGSPEEVIGGAYLEIFATKNPKNDVDSGYAVDEESPIISPVEIEAERQPRKLAKTVTRSDDGSDSLDPSGNSFAADTEESPPAQSKTGRAKKRQTARSVRKKVAPPEDQSSVQRSRKKKTEGVTQESQETNPERKGRPKAKTSTRKKSSGDSLVESPPQNLIEEDAHHAGNTVLGSVSGNAESGRSTSIQDSGVDSIGESSLPLSPMTLLSSRTNIGTVDDFDYNTLESTENLKVVRRRGPKIVDTISDENKAPKIPTFTQPMRKDNPKKIPGLGERRDSAARMTTSNTSTMSQPLPSRSRGKFAPPTRSKTDDYTLEDLQRDLNEGVI